jgi:hypothetical protein
MHRRDVVFLSIFVWLGRSLIHERVVLQEKLLVMVMQQLDEPCWRMMAHRWVGMERIPWFCLRFVAFAEGGRRENKSCGSVCLLEFSVFTNRRVSK